MGTRHLRTLVWLNVWALLSLGVWDGRATAVRSIEVVGESDSRFAVSLDVNPDSGVFVYAVEETIPSGWSVEGISQNGLFDAANSTIKWGPYFDSNAREFQYFVVPEDSAEGSSSIVGTVSYDGNGVVVGGTSLIPFSSGHPIEHDPKSELVGERKLPERVESGTAFEVVIEVTPTSEISVYAVEEKLSHGLVVSGIGGGGSYDASSGSIKWGPFFDSVARSLTYQAVWSSETSQRLEFEGTVSLDGEGIQTGGEQSVDGFMASPEPAPEPAPEPHPTGSQAERELPSRTASGSNIIVSVRLTPTAGASAYALEEQLPSDVILVSLDSGGQFDEESNALKWGPYFDSRERVVRYTIRVPSSVDGNLVFDGRISVDGVGESVGGNLMLAVDGGVPPSAGDGAGMRELPVNAVGGSSIEVSLRVEPPSGVSVYAVEEFFPDGVIVMSPSEGGQIDQESGSIKWGPFFDNQLRVLRYRLLVPESGKGELLFRGKLSLDGQSQTFGGAQGLSITGGAVPPSSGTESAVRRLPSLAGPEEAFEVSILVSPPSVVSVYALEERVPGGAEVISIEESGQWDRETGSIKWGPFFDNQARVMSYTLRLPSGIGDKASFTGNLSLDGASETIGGDLEVVLDSGDGNPPAGGAAQRMLPGSVGAENDFEVSVVVTPPGAVSVYAVEERIPDGLIPFAIGEGGQFDAVSASIKWGPFFDTLERTLRYRLRPGQDSGEILSFAGSLSLDGQSQSIGGGSTVTVELSGEPALPPLPPVTAECSEGGGFLNFLNPRGLVSDVDGTLVGTEVFGQVYAGTNPSDLQPVCQAIRAFGGGIFSGGELAVAGFPGGETVFVQLRAWKGAERFETASVRGASAPVSIVLKSPGALVPAPFLPTLAFSLREISNPPSLLPLTFSDGILTIEWTGLGRLQWADSPEGPYLDHSSQSNPQLVDVSENEFRFYRVVE